ncbi:hypothetical protein [Burkholderia territorii]|uniref:hypothetical protein n=1 Tax=Burkholderia territorii TaxID=1503055 RepID=UPI0011CB91E5|nr:hypothetical protein [Burkholderia territorii]TXG04385.1 hypothetical protein FU139_28705 [Burkholderia territorii]HDR8861811.1 hypothetical protein [Burkholderia territorii]HDR8867915.1 hypothetical protein [Burkholderia territorii]HDR8874131.1 hypothetical protein [Burkholderia territorii]HDR8880375.1 hypothetical protein [Burkholderia territorii]
MVFVLCVSLRILAGIGGSTMVGDSGRYITAMLHAAVVLWVSGTVRTIRMRAASQSHGNSPAAPPMKASAMVAPVSRGDPAPNRPFVLSCHGLFAFTNDIEDGRLISPEIGCNPFEHTGNRSRLLFVHGQVLPLKVFSRIGSQIRHAFDAQYHCAESRIPGKAVSP